MLIVQQNDGQKYLAANVEPDQIESWVKDYSVLNMFLVITISWG